MNTTTLFLAQDNTFNTESVSAASQSFFEYLNLIFRPNELLNELGQVPFFVAAIAVTLGILSVFNGYRWHKWIIAVMAFLIGIGIGYKVSQKMDRSLVVALSIGGLCAIIATPLLRISVAIFGGLAGAFIGANTWTAIESANNDNSWAGAVIGFVVISMLSIMMFRLVVVLFTSLGGALLAVCGAITLMLQVPGWESSVRDALTQNEVLIPLLLALAAVSGFVIQESRLRADGVNIVAQEKRAEE